MSQVPSHETVRCAYCSISLKRKNMREHTINIHGKGVNVKEKLSTNQPLLSAHFSTKRKDDGTDKENIEAKTPKIDQPENVDEYIQDNFKEVLVKVVKENKDELKQDIIEAKKDILSAIEHMNEKQVGPLWKNC